MRQVSEWLDFYQREPWGYEAVDTRNALLALVTAQCAGAKNLKLDSFRIRPRPMESQNLSDDELVSKVREIFKIPRR